MIFFKNVGYLFFTFSHWGWSSADEAYCLCRWGDTATAVAARDRVSLQGTIGCILENGFAWKSKKPSNLMRTDKLFIGSPIEVAICWPYPMFRHTTLFLLKTTVRHGGKQTAGPGCDVPQSTVNECGLDDPFDGFAAETSRSCRIYCRHPPKFIQNVPSKAFWATLGKFHT